MTQRTLLTPNNQSFITLHRTQRRP